MADATGTQASRLPRRGFHRRETIVIRQEEADIGRSGDVAGGTPAFQSVDESDAVLR